VPARITVTRSADGAGDCARTVFARKISGKIKKTKLFFIYCSSATRDSLPQAVTHCKL
jgi:hypothetical protein